MPLSNEVLLRIYRDMIRQRTLDYQLVKVAKSGKMLPGWHSGLGEDAIVAPVALLREDDYVTYTHRGAYVWIARGMTRKEAMVAPTLPSPAWAFSAAAGCREAIFLWR